MQRSWLRSLDELGAMEDPYDDWYGGPEPDEPDLPPDDPRLADLTEVVLLHGEVIDVRRRPVAGSGYECAALELAHLHPTPPPRVERVVVRESPREPMRHWLQRVAGGEEELDALDILPLPVSTPLDGGDLAPDARDLVQAVDEQLALAADGWMIADEVLTASRRLLTAATEVGMLRLWRDLEPRKIAAIVVHCVAKANTLVGQGAPFTVAHWLRDLGTTTAPARRSTALAQAVGGSQWPHGERPPGAPEVLVLGDAAMLVSRFRRQLIAYRELAERLPVA